MCVIISSGSIPSQFHDSFSLSLNLTWGAIGFKEEVYGYLNNNAVIMDSCITFALNTASSCELCKLVRLNEPQYLYSLDIFLSYHFLN